MNRLKCMMQILSIADLCELHCVNEWEVIGAMLDAIEGMGIDITEWM